MEGREIQEGDDTRTEEKGVEREDKGEGERKGRG